MHAFSGWEFRLETRNFDVSQNLKSKNYPFFSLNFDMSQNLQRWKIIILAKIKGVPKLTVYTVVYVKIQTI